MTAKVIPLVDQRAARRVPLIPAHTPAPGGMLADTRGLLLRDLRISVTDRCNFRCTYCMPKSVFDKDYQFLPRTELLSFEEITRVTRLFAAHGVEKIRLTGGEPLLRKNLEVLIEMLAALETHDGNPLDLSLTTNASLLSRKAQAFKAAGLQRITVSLDSLAYCRLSPSSTPSEGCQSTLMPKSVTRSQALGSSAFRNDIVLPEHAPPCSQSRFAISKLLESVGRGTRRTQCICKPHATGVAGERVLSDQRLKVSIAGLPEGVDESREVQSCFAWS